MKYESESSQEPLWKEANGHGGRRASQQIG